jgi:hypothetical protein
MLATFLGLTGIGLLRSIAHCGGGGGGAIRCFWEIDIFAAKRVLRIESQALAKIAKKPEFVVQSQHECPARVIRRGLGISQHLSSGITSLTVNVLCYLVVLLLRRLQKLQHSTNSRDFYLYHLTQNELDINPNLPSNLAECPVARIRDKDNPARLAFHDEFWSRRKALRKGMSMSCFCFTIDIPCADFSSVFRGLCLCLSSSV